MTFETIFKNFQNYILNQSSEITHEIKDQPQIEVNTRLQIYRTAYYLRLLEVLAYDFGMLKTHMGQESFNRFGQAYIQAHPSHSASIMEFGDHFPQFLSTQKEISKEQLELAQFELALEKARPVSVTSKINPDQLSQISPEAWSEIQFILNPTIAQFESCWQAPHLWRSIANELPYPAIEADKIPESWLIWSGQGVSNFCALSIQSKHFLEALKSGQNFGQVCETLCEVMSEIEVGEFAGRYLNQWIVDQIIVEFRIS